MIIIGALLIFAGFFFLYSTAKKSPTNQQLTRFFKWALTHPKKAKSIGVAILILAIMFLIINFGVGAGLFISFVLFMTISSLVIVLSPLRYKL